MTGEPKTRFLVRHDLGAGPVWWRIHARSAREVLETFAGVEVVDDPAVVERTSSWAVDEVDVDDPDPPAGLRDLRVERDAQRGLPGFGALVGRDVVYLRDLWEEDDELPWVYLMEVGPDGRRLRQVEQYRDGTALSSGPEDWASTPPAVDFYAPRWADREITREEFEAAWRGARRDDDAVEP